MNPAVLSIVFSSFVLIASGQEVLTLKACLENVENNALQTVAESGSLNNSKINLQFHRWTLLPNMSANTGINTSFGRRLDPFTNTFATSSVNSQSFGLNASMMLFNGFSYFYKRNRLRAFMDRDEIELNKKRNEGKVRTIETYLDICKLSVQIELAKSRIENYKHIQAVQRLLLKEGRITVIDTLKSHYSLLAEQDLLENLHGESKLKFIDLNFQMGKPLGSLYKVDQLSITALEEKFRFDETYQVKLIEIELKLLENEWKTERAKIFPSISLNGLVGTGFSTNNKDYLPEGAPTKSYSRQINENLYEGIGFYLNIPLFNHGEWIRTSRINDLRQKELESRKELTGQQLEKLLLELEQKRLNIRVKQAQRNQMNNNLELIYTKSLLLYKEGRLTYPEMETAFMEWQQKLMEYQMLRFDLQLLELFE